MKIKGTVVYKNLNGGFWGIETANGGEYLPINMPEQLKEVGAKVTVRIEEVDGFSMHMWGKMVRITGFHTLP